MVDHAYISIPSSLRSSSSPQLLSLAFLRQAAGRLDSKKATWYLTAGVQAAVLLYVSRRLWLEGWTWMATQSNLRRLQQRCFELATQGAEAAGAVPADLGQPDDHDVYSYTSASGRKLFFRQGWQASGRLQWELSADRNLWIPACHADSLWYGVDSNPNSADKVLIQQLQIEASLIAKQARTSSAGAGLPPLDLSNAERDVNLISQVPEAFLCPISMCIMTQPVVTPSGASFDRPAIIDWIRQHHTDPVSGHPLRSDELYPNLVMRDMIHAWAHATPQQQQGELDNDDLQQQDQQQPKDQQQNGKQHSKGHPRQQQQQVLVTF